MTDYARYRVDGDLDGMVIVACKACDLSLNFGTERLDAVVALADEHEADHHSAAGNPETLDHG